MKPCFYVLLAIFILLGACQIKNPALPTWDVELNVPLINQKYFVSDLVDTVNIITDDNQILTLTGNGEVSTREFGNVFFSPDVSVDNQAVPSGVEVTQTLPFVDTAGKLTLAYGEIAGGHFRYRFTNVNATAHIQMIFENVFNADNTPLTVSTNGASTGWINQDLTGLHIGQPNATSVIDGLQIKLVSTSGQPAGTTIGNVSFESLQILSFSRFRGRVNDLSVALRESSSNITIDYPHDVDESITLREARLVLAIENEVGFGAMFNGRLFARNKDGDTLSVAILNDQGENFHVDSATSAGPQTTIMELHSGIEPILQMMPDSLQIINGVFHFNSGTTIGELRNNDMLHVDYTVNAPFHFDLHPHEIVVDSTYTIEVSQENRDRIMNNALSADLFVQLWNMLPIGADAKVFFSTQDSIDVNDPATYSYYKNATINAATSPNVWQPITLSLSKEELNLFAEPNVYYTWSFSFHEANDVIIYARTSDYIHVRSMLKAKVKLEDL